MNPTEEKEHELARLLNDAKRVLSRIWEFDAKGPVLGLACSDINDDSLSEIIIPSQSGEVFALRSDGSTLWSYKANDWARSAFVADIDNDHHNEIVIGSEDSSVHILSDTGELIRLCPISNWARSVGGADLNDDGALDILVGCEDGKVYALDHSCTPLWEFDAGARVYSIFVFCLNEDVNIIVGSQNRKVYLLDKRGAGVELFSADAAIRCLYVEDLDRDGAPEILIGSEDWFVYCIDIKGKERWRFKTEEVVRTVIADDINRDGRIEVIAGGMDDYIYILNHYGDLVWKYKANYRVRTVLTANVTNGVQKELIVGSEDGPVYVYEVNLREDLLPRLRTVFSSLLLEKRLYSLEAWQLQLLEDLGVYIDDPKERFVNLTSLTDALEKHYDTSLERLLRSAARPLSHLWEHASSRRVTGVRWISSFLDDRPAILIVSEDSHCYALDLNGTELWTYLAPDQILSVEVIAERQMIVLGSADAQLYVLNYHGELQRSIKLSDRVWSLSALKNLDLPRIVVGSYDRSIYLVDYEKGREIWSYPAGHWVKTVFTYDIDNNGLEEIVAGAYDDYVYALDSEGNRLWSSKLPDWPNAIHVSDVRNDGKAAIIVASEDSRVYLMDSRGEVLWSYVTGARALCVNSYDFDEDGEEEILAGSADGHVYYLDTSGFLLWRLNVGREIRSVQVGADGSGKYLFVGLGTGETFAFEFVKRSAILQIARDFITLEMENGVREIPPELGVYTEIELLLYSSHDEVVATVLNMLGKSNEERTEAYATRLENVRRALYKHDEQELFKCVITRCLESPIEDIRFQLLRSLANMLLKQDDDYLWRCVGDLASDRNAHIRREALLFLGHQYIEEQGHFAQPILFGAFFNEEDKWVEEEVARAIGVYTSRNQERVFEVLNELLRGDLDLYLLGRFSTSAWGIVREIARTYMHIFSSNAGTSDLAEALDTCVNLSNIIGRTRKQSQIYRSSFTLLRQFYSYSRVEDLASIVSDLEDQSAQQASRNQLFRWLAEHALAEEILRYYNFYFEALDSGSAPEQQTALDSLSGIIARFRRRVAALNFAIERKILEAVFEKWLLVIAERQTELSQSAVVGELKAMLLIGELGHETQVTIELTNLGMQTAKQITLHVKEMEGAYRVHSDDLVLPFLEPMVTAEVTGTIIPFVAQLRRLLVQIDYIDARGYHSIEEYAEVYSSKHIAWREELPLFIYDEKGAITDEETNTPFIGRERLISSIANRSSKTCILYGQKRSGKTSTLYRSLAPAMDNGLIPFFLSFQDLRTSSLDALFYSLLFEYRSLGKHLSDRGRGLLEVIQSFEELELDIPARDVFLKDAAKHFFEVLREINRNLKEHRVVIFADELEDFIALLMEAGKADEVLASFRAIFEHYKNIYFVFTASVNWVRKIGLDSTLHNSFNFVERVKVGFLDREEATSLICDPYKDRVLFPPATIKRAVRATGGNPYLLQKLCRLVIPLLNENKTAVVDLKLLDEALQGITTDLDPCLTNIWSMLSDNTTELKIVTSILTRPKQWKMAGFGWFAFEEILRETGILATDLEFALTSLIDKEYLESTQKHNKKAYRVKIGMLSDWLSETNQMHL